MLPEGEQMPPKALIVIPPAAPETWSSLQEAFQIGLVSKFGPHVDADCDSITVTTPGPRHERIIVGPSAVRISHYVQSALLLEILPSPDGGRAIQTLSTTRL